MVFERRKNIEGVLPKQWKARTQIFLGILIFILFTTKALAQGYICAVGGGSENYNDWSDAPYSWIVQKADSGKIVILSYSDATIGCLIILFR